MNQRDQWKTWDIYPRPAAVFTSALFEGNLGNFYVKRLLRKTQLCNDTPSRLEGWVSIPVRPQAPTRSKELHTMDR